MTDEIAIVVKNLHKEFLLPQHKRTSLKQVFVNIGRRNTKKRQRVLDGISFEVNKGDFFGIVGRNGSGKSTLLKILAGVYSPTAGDVSINGALTPFIELGVGFNPELSGRDNVYLNGALLGFSHAEMDAMYNDIVDFAELGEFMDQKLKNYSSGMQVRLAFSIAIKAKNDILIFDEVLAVGDQAFQRKCLDIFEQYKANKQTIILVTHDMSTVRKFCNKAILISNGKLVASGEPHVVTNKYLELNQQEIDHDIADANEKRQASKLHLEIADATNRRRQSFAVGDAMTVTASWNEISDFESVGINIFKESGEHITGYNSKRSNLKDLAQKRECRLELKLNIAPGTYYLLAEAYTNTGEVAGAVIRGPKFSVTSMDDTGWSGLVPLTHAWKR